MSAQTANLLRSVSNAAWSFARNINSILPHGNLPQPSWAPAPLPRELGEGSDGDGCSKDERYRSAPNAIVRQSRP